MPTPPRMLTFRGETLSVGEWARRRGLSVSTIKSRIDVFGWTVERALTTPPNPKFDPRRPKARPAAAIAQPPRVRRHRTGNSDRDYVRVNGRPLYLGPHGSARAAAAYDRFLAEWRAGHRPDVAATPGRPATVKHLVNVFMAHAAAHYVKDGRPTSELSNYQIALRVVNALYGPTLAGDFTPLGLEACVQRMVELGYVRESVNRHRWRVTNAWRYGVRRGLVDEAVWRALRAVPGLEAGRTAAPDNPDVTPVPDADFAAAVARLPPPHDAMARLQRLLGMRPGDVCAMCVGDLDASDDEWVYTVGRTRKGLHLGKPLRYYLGPRSIELLTPFVAGKRPADRVFTTHRGGRITVSNFRNRVKHSCRAAGVPPWSPHRLRHNRATDVRRKYGSLKAAQMVLGHSDEATSLIYSEPNEPELRRIARETA